MGVSRCVSCGSTITTQIHLRILGVKAGSGKNIFWAGGSEEEGEVGYHSSFKNYHIKLF